MYVLMVAFPFLKEKRAKDKERMRRSSMSSKDEGGSNKEKLQVQWELPVGPPKPRKKRSKRGIVSICNLPYFNVSLDIFS